MSKDFRTHQIRTRQLIASGGVDKTKPYLGLLIYSSSAASNYDGGLSNTNMLQNVGDDVWMVVSGSANQTAYIATQKEKGSSVLFLGDVVVSGTLWAERSIIEVDNTVAGDFIAPNVLAAGTKDMSPAGGNYGKLLVDPFTQNHGKGGGAQQKEGTISFNIVGSPGAGQAWRYPDATNHDVFFDVSGSRGARNTNQRGLALFRGDIHTSGNLSLSPESVITTDLILDNSTDDPPILAQQNSFGKRWTELAVQQKTANAFDVELANSGSDPNSGIKFKVNTGDPDESALVLSGSGDLALDPAVPDGSSEGGTRGVIFNTNQDLSLQSVDWAGTHTSTEAWGKTLRLKRGGSNLEYKSFQISGLTVTASSGMLMGAVGNGANGFWGQALGLMFAGTTVSTAQQGPLGGGPGTAGLYYNNANPFINPHLGGPVHAFVMTASEGAQKIHIGAARTDIWGIEDGVNIHASDPARTDSHGGPIHLYATGGMGVGGVTMWANVHTKGDQRIDGNVEIGKNLTVFGDYIIGHVITASIEDPVLILNSGSLTAPSGGGIAIASGSNFTNQSMVFGRATTEQNTFIAGRLDVNDGAVMDFAGAEPIRVLAAGYRFGDHNDHIITSSNDLMVISASRLAFKPGMEIFLNHIDSGVGAPPAGANYIRYNNGSSSGPLDLSMNVGTGSLRLVPSAGPAILYFGGAATPSTWLAQGMGNPSNGGGTQLFTDQKLTISGSAEIYISASNHLVISASAIAGVPSNPNLRLMAGKVFVSGTNSANYNDGIKLAGRSIEMTGLHADSLITMQTQESPTGIIISGSGGAAPGILYFNVKGSEIGWGASGPQGGGPGHTSDQLKDVNFLVSGSANSAWKPGVPSNGERGTALFQGDLKVSGTAYLGSLAIDNLTLTSNETDEPYIYFRDASVNIHRDTTPTQQLLFTDHIAGTKTLAQLAAIPDVNDQGVFNVTPGVIGNSYKSRVLTTGSFGFHHDVGWEPGDTLYASGSQDIGSDVFIWLSGSINGKNRGDFGTIAIGGDLVTSGAMYFDELSVANVPGTIPDGTVVVYGKDDGGATKLYFKNEIGETLIGSGGSLDDAYDTPDGGGIKSNGAGAVITVPSAARPVQIEAATQGQVALALSGTLHVWGTAGDDSATAEPSIAFQSTHGAKITSEAGMRIQAKGSSSTILFQNNAGGGGLGTSFQITGGSGNFQMAANKYVTFNESELECKLGGKNINAAFGSGTGKAVMTRNFIPETDNTYCLGTPNYRWSDLYTGDLHLKNDRGDWTIFEERDYLCVMNNITGKKYKMALEPLEDDE